MSEIWYLPERKRFWKEAGTPQEVLTVLRMHPRAIHVTNPEAVVIQHWPECDGAETCRCMENAFITTQKMSLKKFREKYER